MRPHGASWEAGVAAGGIGAVLEALTSLAFRSPDPVFFNSLSVGIATLLLGILAGAIYRVRLFALAWTIAAVVVLVGCVALNTLLDGSVAYGAPLVLLAFAVTGLLTPRLADRLVGPVRILAPAGSALVGLLVSDLLVGHAAPPREMAAIPAISSTVAATVPSPVVAAASNTPAREAGHFAGVNFAVGSGSRVTFTVREQLARMPLPNDAVVSATSLTGELHFDGRPSAIQLDLQRLSSDQPNRDKYIRNSIFPGEKAAVFSVDDPQPLPEGTPRGQTLAGHITGMLGIKGGTYPLSFDWQARDDGDVVYVTGHTTFTWQDLGLETPNSSAIVSADDQVNCDVVLAARPK